jgi:hypothetical protein
MVRSREMTLPKGRRVLPQEIEWNPSNEECINKFIAVRVSRSRFNLLSSHQN